MWHATEMYVTHNEQRYIVCNHDFPFLKYFAHYRHLPYNVLLDTCTSTFIRLYTCSMSFWTNCTLPLTLSLIPPRPQLITNKALYIQYVLLTNCTLPLTLSFPPSFCLYLNLLISLTDLEVNSPIFWWVTEWDHPLNPNVSLANWISRHPSMYASY